MKETNNFIKFKHQYYGNYKFKHTYDIFSKQKKIGTIVFVKKNKIFVIGYLLIFPEYRKCHYGYKVIEYILSHYKVDCIVGETLYKASGFWNKCIRYFNGQRKNITTCDNCSSSFVIPKFKIKREEMIKLLNTGYEISEIWN